MENKTTITASKTLAECYAILDTQHFIRVHRSYIINIHHVREYQKGEGGMVVVDNGKN